MLLIYKHGLALFGQSCDIDPLPADPFEGSIFQESLVSLWLAIKTLNYFSAAQFKTSEKDYPVTVVQDACISSSKIDTKPTCPSAEKKNANIAV